MRPPVHFGTPKVMGEAFNARIVDDDDEDDDDDDEDDDESPPSSPTTLPAVPTVLALKWNPRPLRQPSGWARVERL
jgi:hypothetical protein